MNDASVMARAEGAILRIAVVRGSSASAGLETPEALAKVLRTFRDDPDLRVAILSIDGEQRPPALAETPRRCREAVFADHEGLRELRSLNKPVIACVQGAAIDVDVELVLACDLIYASQAASFGLPSVGMGHICAEAAIKLPRRIPYHVALELLYTGRAMDAQEARRWGLVNAIWPQAELVLKIDEIAVGLAGGPPLVFAAIKEVARAAEGEAFQESMSRVTRRQLPAVDALYGSEDMLEGFRAFAEKRAPVWKGC